jgi:hypothetical protein
MHTNRADCQKCQNCQKSPKLKMQNPSAADFADERRSENQHLAISHWQLAKPQTRLTTKDTKKHKEKTFTTEDTEEH